MTERIRKFILDTNWTKAALIALIALGAVAWFQACMNQRLPAAPMPPTDTPTPFVSTHIPTRTLTPTWTPAEPTKTPAKTDVLPSRTATEVPPTLTPTVTHSPTVSTPTRTAIASTTTSTPTIGLLVTPGRNLTPILPETGGDNWTDAPTSTPAPTLDLSSIFGGLLVPPSEGQRVCKPVFGVTDAGDPVFLLDCEIQLVGDEEL